MPNIPIIHLNKKFHVPLTSICSITQKKWGRIWVAFIDPRTNCKKIAIAKNSMSNLLTIVNTYKIMRGERPIIGIYEK